MTLCHSVSSDMSCLTSRGGNINLGDIGYTHNMVTVTQSFYDSEIIHQYSQLEQLLSALGRVFPLVGAFRAAKYRDDHATSNVESSSAGINNHFKQGPGP